jgi:hypothetical protein
MHFALALLLISISCFSSVLRAHAECLESEELAALSVNRTLLPILDNLLLQVYTMLRPKPLDYEQRTTLVHVFNNIANQIFGMLRGIIFLSFPYSSAYCIPL